MSTTEEIKGAKRQLAIKTGVVKRLAAEVRSYVKEAADQQATADRLAADPTADEWAVRNATKVLADCTQMVEPARQRARDARHELDDLLAIAKEEPELLASDELNKAVDLLAALDASS